MEHYSAALEAVAAAPAEGAARTTITLLLNRAQARLKLREYTAARRDCEGVLALDARSLKVSECVRVRRQNCQREGNVRLRNVARVWESSGLCKALYRGALACHKLNEFDVAIDYLLRAQTLAPTVRVPPSLTRPFRF